MITIPQHGRNGELFDIAVFLPLIDEMIRPDHWLITIEWCTGTNAIEIEERSKSGLALSDEEFRVVYGGIEQTIDGSFVGSIDGKPVIDLLAVDSSYWEISGPPAFEARMQTAFGLYSGA